MSPDKHYETSKMAFDRPRLRRITTGYSRGSNGNKIKHDTKKYKLQIDLVNWNRYVLSLQMYYIKQLKIVYIWENT